MISDVNHYFQTDLISICQENLVTMADCLAATTKQDSFVSQKKCRDMRGGETINNCL